MSKPVLPNQNDRYWGYNLNNYLLSLDKRVQTLETAEGDVGSIAIAMGPGFVSRSYKSSTGSYDISDKAAEFPSILISGDIYFGAISNGGMIRTKKTLADYQLFKTIAFTTYNATENKWSNPVETPDAKLYTNRFLNVYLMKTDSGDAVQTVIANDFIFREDMVLVGTLEKTSDTPTYTTFIPRTFDSSKTLYQTAQDSMSSYARLDQMTFGTTASTTLPVAGTFYPDQDEGKTKVNFLFGTNGINPTVTPEPTSDTYEEEFDLLRKIVLKEDITIWYESAVDGEMFTITPPDLETDKMISYYVAPSGNLYTQTVARPVLLYDFNTEVIDNLRLRPELRCGSLVYLGSICKDEASYLWYGAKGNGISPTVVDIDNWNPYKVLLPHRQYYFDTSCFKISAENKNAGYLLLKPEGIDTEHGTFSTFATYSKLDILATDQQTTTPRASLRIADGGGALRLFAPDNATYNATKNDSDDFNFYQLDCADKDFHIFCDGQSSETLISDKLLTTATSYVIDDSVFDITRPFYFSGYELHGDSTSFTLSQGSTPQTITVTGKTDSTKTFTCTYYPMTKTISYQLTSEYDMILRGYALSSNPTYTKGVELTFHRTGQLEIPYLKTSSSTANEFNGKVTITTGGLDVTGNTNVGSLTASGTTSLQSVTATTITTTGAATVKGLTTTTLSATSTASFTSVTASSLTTTGDINIGGATNYTSDIRLKTNIQPINQEQCYKAVQQLPVSTYTYTTTKQDSLGLIAQDIEKYLPEYAHILVHEDENGYKSVFEHKLLFILWEALKHEIIERKKLGGN